MTTIREGNLDLQYLALEIGILRQYNLAESIRLVREGHTNVPEADRPRVLGDLQARFRAMPHDLIKTQPERLALTAEACVVLVWLERVLRVALKKTGPQFNDVSLPTLLTEATGKKKKTLMFPPKYDHSGEIIQGITAFRNAVLHGNIESLTGRTLREFYAQEYVRLIEELYEITNHFAEQLRNASQPT